MPLQPSDVKVLNIPSKVLKHLLTGIALYVLLACCQFCQLVPGDMAGWNPEKSNKKVLPVSNLTLHICTIVGHPEPEKKILLAFLSTFWHPCSKCILMCFNKDRGGCQVWKCPKVPELGQRSTECKFLYIHQILAFLSISYPKL